jgi:hypothetical protein
MNAKVCAAILPYAVLKEKTLKVSSGYSLL